MESQINEYELQRLLDGRLPESERISFLHSVDDQPRQWRSVALAFVEEQVLRAEMQELMTDPEVAPDVKNEPTRRDNTVESAPRASWRWLAAVVLLGAGIFAGNAMPLTWFKPLPDQKTDVVAKPASETDKPNYYVVIPTVPADPESDVDSAMDIGGVTSSIFDQRSRDILRQHGYDVTEEPVLLMVQDDQGGRYWIPQRRVSLVSRQDNK